MNLPNTITLTRIAVIPFFMWAVSAGQSVAALVLFLAASVTDLLDGYLARRMNLVSNFGKLIDPLADKLLVTSALLWLCADGAMPFWAAMVILTREFLVTSLRTVAASAGMDIAASASGKIKTVTQITCLSFMISPLRDATLYAGVTVSGQAWWTMLVVTVWSGIDYLWRYRSVFGTIGR